MGRFKYCFTTHDIVNSLQNDREAVEEMKRAKAQLQTATVQVSELVPRRRPGTQGRRAPNYPDLNFRRIAEAIGISATFLGRIMNGRVRASIDTAQRLAAYLGWPLDQVAALYGDTALTAKFPYRKKEELKESKHPKENRKNGKSLVGAAGRGKKRTGTAKAGKRKPVSRPVADPAHKRK
jgi:transcriptional regulator with XRE-family HTH domain